MYYNDRTKKIILAILALLFALLVSLDMKIFNAMTPEEYATEEGGRSLVKLFYTEEITEYRKPFPESIQEEYDVLEYKYVAEYSDGSGAVFYVPVWRRPYTLMLVDGNIGFPAIEPYAATTPNSYNSITAEDLQSLIYTGESSFLPVEVHKNEKQNTKAMAFLFSGLLVFASFFFVIVQTFKR